jgi:hypothetical protein
MHRSLLVRQVLPSAGIFAGLILAGITFDYALHRAGLSWVGLYRGPIGTILLLLSLLYSLRTRKLIRAGSPKALLALHESLAWAGSLCLVLHRGIHFSAVLLRRAIDVVKAEEATPDSEDNRVLNAATVDLLRRWRVVHMPLNAIFAALAQVHIAAVAFFWHW